MNEEKEVKKENPEEVTFEAAIARLEEIVRSLESGSAPLDESLALFEEGVSLVKLCNARLDTAEQKVKLLTLNPDGTAEERDMPPMT
ncbi:MAG: exodeoxyribonuclease VII small subunit [Clostridia bacterium]|nr:exodeoxyribonuclease VII small subunit [Clostridia bacterium]MBR5367535.1 exodeoxyribonuclease VII small subunit [Clostridia bacterium]